MAKHGEEAAADDAVPPPLWFAPPLGERDRRRTLTRERVVAEALVVIGADGVDSLSMRALATRLGVVPGPRCGLTDEFPRRVGLYAEYRLTGG